MPFRPGKPTFVIAHTHKGHPISFMSNNVAWHHKVPSDGPAAQALDELDRHVTDARRLRRNPVMTTATTTASRRPRAPSPTSRASTAANAYVETLADLAENDHRIVGVVNDSVGSSKLDAFKKAFPDRLINVGIAEQDMVGVAAGLANGGRIPFVSAASCFLTARALEQIKADVAYSNRNVKLCGMSPGMAYGELGPDPPLDRGHRLAPGHRQHDHHRAGRPDRDRRRDALGRRDRRARRSSGSAGWACRRSTPTTTSSCPARRITVRDGDDVTIISNGTVLWRALAAAEQLAAEGISARVISMPTVKPLDAEAVRRRRPRDRRHRHRRGGDLGRRAGRRGRRDRRRSTIRPGSTILGFPEFAPTGSAGFLLDRYGMSPEGIADSARALLNR